MNRRKVIVYVSGPYSGDVEANISRARQAAVEIWNRGFTALCPHLNTIHFEKDCSCQYEDYIRGDLQILARVDIVLMLNAWQASRGACQEHEEALAQGIPVVYSIEQLEAWYAEKPIT